MATARYIKKLKQWQVRWHITDPFTKDRLIGSKLLPKGCTRIDAERIIEEKNSLARQIKLGDRTASEQLKVAKRLWLRHCEQHTQRTQEHYNRIISLFLASLPPRVKRIDQLKAPHIRAYLQGLLDRGRVAATSNRHLTPIKSFCRWLSLNYKMLNIAADIHNMKEDPPRTRFLTRSEYQKAVRAAPEYIRVHIVFIANTGLRASEFARLTWRCVSEMGDSITITGKGRKRRTVPLNETCRAILTKIKPKKVRINSPIFISKSSKHSLQGEATSRKALLQQCKSVAKLAGIESFGSHALRHYFATQLLLSGVPMAKVSHLLGHASVKTTEQRYIHILPSDLHGLTDCLAL